MEIQYKLSNGTMTIKLCGELDEYTANYTRNALDELLLNNSFMQAVIDLSELEFMDSTGIGVLIGRYKKLKNSKTPIYILNPNNHIEKIFKMSGLYDIMPKIS